MEETAAIQPADRRFIHGSMYFFLINGAILLMTSSLLIYLMREYKLSYEEGGLLLTVQAIGSLITNYLSSPISVRIGRKNTLILTAIGFFIGVSIITLTPPLPVLYVGLFLTGLSWGCSNNLINFLLVRETDGDSGKIAAVHTSFSIGAFFAPLLVALTAKLDISWRWASGFICLMAFSLIFVTLFMPVKESSRPTGTRIIQNNAFFRDWRFYLFMMMLFLYVGVETGFSGWIVTYLSGFRNFSASAAQSLLSVLWISIITGRLMVAFYGSHFKKARFLMLEGCGILFAALGLILSSNSVLLVLSVIVLGLSLSAFYGMVVSNASYLITRSSRASGIMMAFGSLGASTLPFLAGVFAERRDIVAGLWVLCMGAVILLILTILHVAAPKSKRAV